MALLIFCAALSGCATNRMVEPAQAAPIVSIVTKGTEVSQVSQVSQVSEIDKAILRELTRASKVYEQMAEASASTMCSPIENDYELEKLPKAWSQELNLLNHYYGHLDDFIRLISLQAGMQPPHIISPNFGKPVFVAMKKGQRSFINWVADAGHQAGDKALLTADIGNHKILITYP